MNNSPNKTEIELKHLISRQIELHWPSFEKAHPHLAAAIQQIQLTEHVAKSLASDPKYQRAMEAATRDQRTIETVLPLVQLVDRWVRHVLGL